MRPTVSEQFRERFHALIVSAALAVIGLLLIYNGSIDLPEIEQPDRDWVMWTCLAGGVISLVLAALVYNGRIAGSYPLDISMAVGLVAAIVCNAATGIAWPEGVWIACGYTMALVIAAGVTLRNDYLFAFVILFAAASWALILGLRDEDFAFKSDATTLVIVGMIIAVAVFIFLRVERHFQQSLAGDLREQAAHDPLTGALNRLGLQGRLGELDGRSTDGSSVWCAYLDVDYFKAINDRKGHDFGDEVLRKVADELRAAVGDEALVARWGGDEFVVISDGPAPSEESVQQRIDAGLASHAIDANVSVGISSATWTSVPDVADLIELADLQMYGRRDRHRASGDDSTPQS